MVMRIAAYKFLEYGFGLGRIVKIILIDLSNGKQRIEAVPAARIFPSQKLIFANGRAQSFVIIEMPSHFRQ